MMDDPRADLALEGLERLNSLVELGDLFRGGRQGVNLHQEPDECLLGDAWWIGLRDAGEEVFKIEVS